MSYLRGGESKSRNFCLQVELFECFVLEKEDLKTVARFARIQNVNYFVILLPRAYYTDSYLHKIGG